MDDVTPGTRFEARSFYHRYVRATLTGILRYSRLVGLGFTASLVLATVLAASSVAHAEQILEKKSSWNESHDFIYTDFKVRRDDGSVVTRRVPGGSVDGIGMVQLDSV